MTMLSLRDSGMLLKRATASRANYTKFIAAYPEYAEDFQKPREAFYGGSETGEAQKKIEAEKKQVEADIGAASGYGLHVLSWHE
jgi:hypothetical protein